MLKFRRGRIALCLFLLASAALSAGVVHMAAADDSSPWLTSTLYLNKVKDVAATDIPSTFFGSGNTDCTVVYDGKCSIDTPYGAVWSSSVWLDGKWRPIKDYGGNSSNFFAIPNSDTAFTTSSPSGFGSYLYFTDDTSLALSPNYLVGPSNLGTGLTYFQLNRQYDRKLTDKTGNRLIADLNSMAFSGDGKWMVVTDPNITNLRVNLNTGEALPFGKAFTYGYGQNPIPKNAISSDGQYALEAARDTSSFTIYDLSTCATSPDTITHSVNCTGRELFNSGYLSSHVPGYSGTLYARFVSDDTLMFYASYKEGPNVKYGQYILSTDFNSTSQLQYLALGDSYISGEGTFDYIAGSDTSANKCHLSLFSYPYLIGSDLSLNSYNSVACSGATTDDVINSSDSYDGQTTYQLTKDDLQNTPQFDIFLNTFSPGWIDQLEFVKKYQPQAVTISIGGNDMGFSKILFRCVKPSPSNNTCYSTFEDRLELVNSINNTVFPNLVKTYAQLKNTGPAGMRIYVIGYPQIAMPGGDCAVNVQLNNDELVFAQQLISYLDGVIKDAADRTGVKYVDTQDALNGHRLCEAGQDSIAMNGITAGNDRPSTLGGPLGDESYHPNKVGYRLLEEKILAETHSLSGPTPAANPAAAPPAISTDLEILRNTPHSGRSINSVQYDPSITTDLVYRGTPINVNINGVAHSLAPGTTLKAELHSTPINLGTFQTSGNRSLMAQAVIPSDTEAGYHTLHFYGSDIASQPIDIYKTIYVAATADDLDGNGLPDSKQSCIGVPESGEDIDQDGIDDACDGNIGSPPVNQPETQKAEGATKNLSTNPMGAQPRSGGSVQATTTGTQAQDFGSNIVIADSVPDSAPAVLAAKTVNSALSKPNQTKSAVQNSKKSWAVAVSLSALAGLVFAAKRWVF